MGDSQDENRQRIVVQEYARGIPATQLVDMISKLGTFLHDENVNVPLPLWDLNIDANGDGIAVFAVAPDLEDEDSEYVAYWHFGQGAWVWEP